MRNHTTYINILVCHISACNCLFFYSSVAIDSVNYCNIKLTPCTCVVYTNNWDLSCYLLVSELGMITLNVIKYKYNYFVKVTEYNYNYFSIFSKVIEYDYNFFSKVIKCDYNYLMLICHEYCYVGYTDLSYII